MAGIAAGGEIKGGLAAKNLGRRRAAGIYGAIITAAILDTAGGHLSTTALVISVVVTLLVYWLAEEYCRGPVGPAGHSTVLWPAGDRVRPRAAPDQRPVLARRAFRAALARRMALARRHVPG
jgi:hypothetical protein